MEDLDKRLAESNSWKEHLLVISILFNLLKFADSTCLFSQMGSCSIRDHVTKVVSY